MKNLNLKLPKLKSKTKEEKLLILADTLYNKLFHDRYDGEHLKPGEVAFVFNSLKEKTINQLGLMHIYHLEESERMREYHKRIAKECKESVEVIEPNHTDKEQEKISKIPVVQSIVS
jgi:hypothetical protein